MGNQNTATAEEVAAVRLVLILVLMDNQNTKWGGVLSGGLRMS